MFSKSGCRPSQPAKRFCTEEGLCRHEVPLARSRAHSGGAGPELRASGPWSAGLLLCLWVQAWVEWMPLPGPAVPELFQGTVLRYGQRGQGCGPEVRGPRPSGDSQGAGFTGQPGGSLACSWHQRTPMAAAALRTISTSGVFALAGAQMSSE